MMPNIDLIDPSISEIETEKNSTEIHIELIYQKIFYIFKIVIILLSLFIIVFLMLIVITPERGIIIQPFDSNQKNLNGIFAANHLYFELQEIKKINNKKISSSESQYDYDNKYLNMPSVSLKAGSIDYCVTGLGNVGVAGMSLSLGQLVLSIKQFTGHSTPILYGCIVRSGSNLRIIAILNDPGLSGGTEAWETCKNISVSDTGEEDIPLMIEDLAFQIATSLINEDKYSWWDIFHFVDLSEIDFSKNPQTWEAFKNLTLSRKAYIKYTATGNINDLNRAREYASNANRSEPDCLETAFLFSLLGSSYLKLHDYSEAEQLFRNAVYLNPSDKVSWSGIGLVLLENENFSESIQAFDKATRIDPRYAEAWNNKGVALMAQGMDDEALQAYNQSITIDQKLEAAWFNKGLALYEKNYFNESIMAYDRAINLEPTDSEALTNKGASYYRLKNYPQAIQTLNDAINITPNNMLAWCIKGLALGALDEFDSAIQAFDQAIKIDSNNGEAWYYKGMALYNKDMCREAIEAYGKAIMLDPKYAKELEEEMTVQARSISIPPCMAATSNFFNKSDAKNENLTCEMERKPGSKRH
jgi:tetratricopeptide (TPR) repeat protein